ncbi:hypothetical protein GCM10025734_12190 [Kitasatospora paranensis]|uniref:AMP-binding protein n=1 Tax=Kitasatospora paranensis TaxID=258053 RepID=UPI0031EFAA46
MCNYPDSPARHSAVLPAHCQYGRARGRTATTEGWPDAGEAQTVHGLFERLAALAPDAPAVVCGGVRLSYGELDARANRLARHLNRLGLGPGRLAAIALGRDTELVVAVLAVLKTGAAYLPVEPSGPDLTVRHAMAAARPSVIVTEEAHRVRLADCGERAVLCLDTAAAETAAEDSAPLDVVLPPDAAACLFTTSGSTGLPKATLVEHRNLLHSHRGWCEVYGLTAADRFLQTATLEFDVFTADVVRALCTGGTLVLARRNFTLDRTAELSELHRLVLDERITVMETNVHTARRLLDHLQPRGLELGGLRLLTVGAEKWYLDEHLRLQGYLGPGVRVINVYGVAEAAVDSTYFDPATLGDVPEHPERISLIGVPFPGNRVHLLDAAGRPVPDGVPGEICLAGPGVGPGYPALPDLTAARFTPTDLDPDGRLYRTGDLGRLRPDGVLEYIGRAGSAGAPGTQAGEGDTESAEVTAARVEAVLRGHPEVRECAVNAVTAPPDGRRGGRRGGRHRAPVAHLVAYLVGADGAAPRPRPSAPTSRNGCPSRCSRTRSSRCRRSPAPGPARSTAVHCRCRPRVTRRTGRPGPARRPRPPERAAADGPPEPRRVPAAASGSRSPCWSPCWRALSPTPSGPAPPTSARCRSRGRRCSRGST